MLQDAIDNKIPVYFVRSSFNRGLGGIVADDMWRDAVNRTGGRFYAVSDEGTILQAVREIDKLAPGRIQIKEYTIQRPRYAPYALIAVMLWAAAIAAKLTVPYFRKFP